MRKFQNKVFLYINKNIPLTRFIIVGVIIFIIHFCLFILFYNKIGLDYKTSATIAYIVCVINHYTLSKYFTFKAANQNGLMNSLKYILLLVQNYFITMLAYSFAKNTLGLPPSLWPVLATGSTALLSYLTMRYFVFRF